MLSRVYSRGVRWHMCWSGDVIGVDESCVLIWSDSEQVYVHHSFPERYTPVTSNLLRIWEQIHGFHRTEVGVH